MGESAWGWALRKFEEWYMVGGADDGGIAFFSAETRQERGQGVWASPHNTRRLLRARIR